MSIIKQENQNKPEGYLNLEVISLTNLNEDERLQLHMLLEKCQTHILKKPYGNGYPLHSSFNVSKSLLNSAKQNPDMSYLLTGSVWVGNENGEPELISFG